MARSVEGVVKVTAFYGERNYCRIGKEETILERLVSVKVEKTVDRASCSVKYGRLDLPQYTGVRWRPYTLDLSSLRASERQLV